MEEMALNKRHSPFSEAGAEAIKNMDTQIVQEKDAESQGSFCLTVFSFSVMLVKRQGHPQRKELSTL